MTHIAKCVGRYCYCFGRRRVKEGEPKRISPSTQYPDGPLYQLDKNYTIEGDRLRIYEYLQLYGKSCFDQIKNELNLTGYATRTSLRTLLRLKRVKKGSRLIDINIIFYDVEDSK